MVTHRKTMSFLTTSKPKADVPPELDPTPRLLTAPELVGREREHVVIRQVDETDESYVARCNLVNLILGTPPKS
jgi:hypothetical protein